MPKKQIKITETHKECSKCKQMVLIGGFASDVRKPYGLASYCKECRRNYYISNKTEILKRRKTYREANRDKVLESKKRYYKNNHKKIRELAKLNYEQNKENILRKNKIWRKNSLRGRFMDCKRAAAKRNKEFNISLEKFNAETQKPCGYCGTVDEKRGLDRIDNNVGYLEKNVISCCWQCNWMKSDYSVKEFLTHCQKILDYSKLKSQHE